VIYRKFCVFRNGYLTGLCSAAVRLGWSRGRGAFLWAGLTPRDRRLVFLEGEAV